MPSMTRCIIGFGDDVSSINCCSFFLSGSSRHVLDLLLVGHGCEGRNTDFKKAALGCPSRRLKLLAALRTEDKAGTSSGHEVYALNN